ncbi:ABC transporter permease [Halobacterium wangiae]|uniref:ABC transporter permease n=1 Tax=Halobacterium wangiae TaxID=2902623 RepID=UPI001E45C70B|nr:ABC transporter permease [Halobacterium wangiae]
MAERQESIGTSLRETYDGWRTEHAAQISEVKLRASQIRSNPVSLAGLGIICLFLLVAALAPYIAPYSPMATDIANTYAQPSLEHPFGTDSLGRDVFSRVIFGTQSSLRVAAIVLAVSFSIGVPTGLVAGYLGGKVEEAIMRITDMFLGFPPLLLPLAVSLSLGGGLDMAAIAIGLTWWPWYARIGRSQAINVREEEYVTAAESIGVTSPRIVARHVFPNSLSPILVQASMDVGYAILMTSSLSFIGAGANPPAAEWGLMIATAREGFITYWWTVTFPGIAIFVTVIGFNLFGDGLRDILDPKLSRR